jgi:hypothetical protein
MRRGLCATRSGRGTDSADGPPAPSPCRSSEGGSTAHRGLARVRQSCTTRHDSTRHDQTRHDTTQPALNLASGRPCPSPLRVPTPALPSPRSEGRGVGVRGCRGAGAQPAALLLPGEPWAFHPIRSCHAPDLGVCPSDAHYLPNRCSHPTSLPPLSVGADAAPRQSARGSAPTPRRPTRAQSARWRATSWPASPRCRSRSAG